jgi:hypothetical protein
MEVRMTWVTDAEARLLNADLDTLDEAELGLYLDAAYEACVAFLPEGPDYTAPAAATASRKIAQVMQATNIWKAGRTNAGSGGGSEFGAGEFTITTFPLDFHVKQLLRPKRGIPAVA